ncbi:nucleoside deaminase [Parapedobacter lycopersici]|uniref:nucleoside deaminase n=1 Tax=Parapedobacter lycopersici TaxID=1864939 RepID=UPI00214DDDFB|nr:nucleoside deaminase [Parapedobacter lycopersici]
MKYINFEDAEDAVSDEYFMKLALKEAQQALAQDEVPIGAVITYNGRIIGKGHNLTERLGDVTAHAEMQAFTAAAHYIGGKYLQGCTLYVTVEPCVMCAGAAYWTQISRIVFGALDEKRGFSGFGDAILHPKTTIVGGVLANECAELVTSFFRNKRLK